MLCVEGAVEVAQPRGVLSLRRSRSMLLQGESDDVVRDRRVGAGSEIERKPTGKEHCQAALAVDECVWPDGNLGDEQRQRIGVALQHLVEGAGAAGDGVLPRCVAESVGVGVDIHLAEDSIDDVEHELVLAGEVSVERRGARPQALREQAHAERVRPDLVDDLKRDADDPLE